MKLNDTQAVILGLILSSDGREVNAHEIVTMHEKWISPYFTITRSQVYRELPTMTEWGLVKPGIQGPRGALPYRVTVQGKAALVQWMEQPISLDPMRNSAALRHAFAEFTSKEQLTSIRDQYIALHMKALNEIHERLQEAHDEELWNDQGALRFAYGYHQAVLDWLGVKH